MRYKKGMLITSTTTPVVMVQSIGQYHYHCLDKKGSPWYIIFEAAMLARPDAPISSIGKFI